MRRVLIAIAVCIGTSMRSTSPITASTGTWSDPCTQQVGTPPTGPSCSISGVDSVCAGSSVHLCGPTGSYAYAWTGPGGFGATTSCVDVSAAGTYSLRVTDMSNGAG